MLEMLWSDSVLQPDYLQQMGITRWVLREQKTHISSLDILQQKVSQCTRCALHETRTQTVFARGNPKARLMIVGEAPGFYEDKQGEPFVGKAGILLNKMLQSIQLTPDDVYIANVIKCRPPNNRDPEPDEIQQCSNYLLQQIEAVKPQLLLGLGRFAGQFLSRSTWSLSKLRSEDIYYQGIQAIITYHPAYLLRNPADKKQVYQDLSKVREVLGASIRI